jgi:hypothetical protein
MKYYFLNVVGRIKWPFVKFWRGIKWVALKIREIIRWPFIKLSGWWEKASNKPGWRAPIMGGYQPEMPLESPPAGWPVPPPPPTPNPRKPDKETVVNNMLLRRLATLSLNSEIRIEFSAGHRRDKLVRIFENIEEEKGVFIWDEIGSGGGLPAAIDSAMSGIYKKSRR